MYFDAIIASAIVDELHDLIVGGRVQKIIDLNAHDVGLEIFANGQRHYLLLSASPQQPRTQLVADKLRRGLPHPTQVGLLMRRYLDGAYLEDVIQPAWERVITFHFDGPEGPCEVILEAMERRANILLVRDGMIQECIRRVGPRENRVRLSLPGHKYVPPPLQVGKLPPDILTEHDIGAYLDSDPGTNAQRTLTRRIMGMSPQLARELVYRATGRPNAKAADTSALQVYDAMQEVMPPLFDHAWHPGIARDDEGRVIAYSVYPLTYKPGWESSESISAAMAAYYGELVGKRAYDDAKAPVQAQLTDAIKRIGGKVTSLQKSLKSEDELAHLRQSGELLLAYQYTIDPGADSFSAQYDPDAEPLDIKLDPALTPLENSQRYFEKYNKAKRALADVPRRLRAAQNEIAFLRQLETDLALAANRPDIDEVQVALQTDGYWRGPQQAKPKGQTSAPLKITEDEFVIWVGRNARQNDLVTFSKGGAEDLWVHVRGIPGAHVIIKGGGRPVPDEVIERAAELAAYFSAARDEGRVPVDVTRRKHVRKIKGGKPGMVTYRHEETWDVQPRGPE